MPSLAFSLAALIAATALPDAAALSNAPDNYSESIAMDRATNQRLTVPVRIAGKGPFDFLIDTGAEATVLSGDLAIRLKLPRGQNARIVSFAERQEVETARFNDFQLGRRNFNDVIAPLLQRQHIGADGILGLDNLKGQRVQLDFKRNLLQVDVAKQLGGSTGYEIVVSARRRENQLIITEAAVDGVPTAIIIDTGSEFSVGNRALQAKLKRAQSGRITMTSVTGGVLECDIVIPGQITLDRFTLTNPAIAFADAAHFKALGLDKRPAMMLGMRELRLFDRVAIDFQQKKVLFDLPGNQTRRSGERWQK